VLFSKRNLEPILLNFEEFISIKGIKAQGNQLTADKIKQVNMLEPLPYEAPVIEDVEVNDEEVIDNSPESFDDDSDSENDSLADEAGQIKLF